MGSFPITINDQRFSNNTLGGKKYTKNYPDLLSAVVAQGDPDSWYLGTWTIEKDFYPRYGRFTLVFSPNKMFYPGMFFNVLGPGAIATMGGYIVSYNKDTGSAEVQIEFYSPQPFVANGVYPVRGSVITSSPNGSSALGISQGGTGQKTSPAALLALEISMPKYFLEEVYDDFIEYINPTLYSYPWQLYSLVGGATFGQYPGTIGSPLPAADFGDRAGFLELSVTSVLDQVVLIRGEGGYLFNSDSVYEFAVMVPVLSDATNRFKLRAGLKSRDSTQVDIFNYGGIGVTYTDSENGGSWRVVYAATGSATTFDTAVPVVAGQWYKVKVVYNGISATVYIDGVSVLSGLTAIPLTGAGNLMSPAFQLTKSVGSAERTALADYIYRLQRVTR